MTTLRVLHVVNGEHISGPERVVDGLVAHAEAADPLVVSLMPGEYWRARRPDVVLCESRGRLDLGVVQRLATLIRSAGIDVVHTHTVRANLVGRLAARFTGRMAVDHVHSPTWNETTSGRSNWLRATVDDGSRRLSRLHIAVSEWLASQLVERGYPAERVVVCPNGIDVDRVREIVAGLDVAAVRIGLNLPQDVPIVGMFAMFRARKGADVLLRAFARSRSCGQGAMLLMVGGSYASAEGTYLDTLQDEARSLGIADQCVFTGFQKSVIEWMAAATVGVVPSLFGEGLPIALLEQMAVGLPTIASDAPGIAEVASKGRGITLVPVGDESALADAIDQVVASETMRRSMGEQAVLLAHRYSLVETTRCVEGAYRLGLGGRAQR